MSGVFHDLVPATSPWTQHSTSDLFINLACDADARAPQNIKGYQKDGSPCDVTAESSSSQSAPIIDPCDSYAGIATYSVPYACQSQCEYIEYNFEAGKQPKVGKPYYASFKSSWAETSLYATKVGMALSSAQLQRTLGSYSCGSSNEAIFASLCPESNNYIYSFETPNPNEDYQTWTKAGQAFIPASTINYLTIGRIFPACTTVTVQGTNYTYITDNLSLTISPSHAPLAVDNFAYYYIDDIEVLSLPEAGGTISANCYQPVRIGYYPSDISDNVRNADWQFEWKINTGSNTYIPVPPEIMDDPTQLEQTVRINATTVFTLFATSTYYGSYQHNVIVSILPSSTVTTLPLYFKCGGNPYLDPVATPKTAVLPGGGSHEYRLQYWYKDHYEEVESSQDPIRLNKSGLYEGLYKIELETGLCSAETPVFLILGTEHPDASYHTDLDLWMDAVILDDVDLFGATTLENDATVWVAGKATTESAPNPLPPVGSSLCSPSQTISGPTISIKVNTSSSYSGLNLAGGTLRGICSMWKGIVIEDGCDLVAAYDPVRIQDANVALDFTASQQADPVELDKLVVANCRVGISANTARDLSLDACTFYSKPEEFLPPFDIDRAQRFSCASGKNKKFDSEYFLQVIGSGYPRLELKNSYFVGGLFGAYIQEVKAKVEHSSFDQIQAGILMTNGVLTVENSQFKSNRSTGIGTLNSVNIVHSSYFSLADDLKFTGWNYGTARLVSKSLTDNWSWDGPCYLRTWNPQSDDISQGNYFGNTELYPDVADIRGVFVAGGQGPMLVEGNTFEWLSPALTLSGTQQNANEIINNRFRFNRLGIEIGNDYVAGPTNSSSIDPDATFVLKCNDFEADIVLSSSTGMYIAPDAQLDAIGSCALKSGNAWGIDPYSVSQSPTNQGHWQTVPGFTSIYSAQPNGVVLNRYDKEFIENSSGVSLTYDCLGSGSAVTWFNPPSIGEQGCIESFMAPFDGVTRIKNARQGSETSNQCRIFPNPNKGSFTVLSQYEIQSIEILSPSGQQLWHRTGLARLEMEVRTELPAGLYYCRVHTTKGIEMIKYSAQ